MDDSTLSEEWNWFLSDNLTIETLGWSDLQPPDVHDIRAIQSYSFLLSCEVTLMLALESGAAVFLLSSSQDQDLIKNQFHCWFANQKEKIPKVVYAYL